MSGTTRCLRVSVIVAGLVMWGLAGAEGTEKQAGHQPAAKAATPAPKPEAKTGHETPAAEAEHGTTAGESARAKPAGRTAGHGTVSEKRATPSRETKAADGHAPEASAHGEALEPKAGAGTAQKARKRSGADPVESAREVVRRIETIMTMESARVAPPKSGSAAAKHTTAAALAAGHGPAPAAPQKAKPGPRLRWDSDLVSGRLSLTWDSELAPRANATTRAGIRLTWPVDVAKTP